MASKNLVKLTQAQQTLDETAKKSYANGYRDALRDLAWILDEQRAQLPSARYALGEYSASELWVWSRLLVEDQDLAGKSPVAFRDWLKQQSKVTILSTARG